MSGRRPRYVIKPNIRPGVTKSAGTTLKPKASATPAAPDTPVTTKSSTSEKASNSSEEQVHVATEEISVTHALSEEDENSKKESVKGLNLRVVSSNTEQEESELFCSPKKAQSVEKIPQVDTNPATNIDPQNETSEDGVSNQSIRSQSPHQHSDVNQKEGASVSEVPVVESDKGNEIKDNDGNDGKILACEVDGSEIDSVASSLELESERQGDLGEAGEKKLRRKRSKKPQLDALPSRDKSPDRQTMKICDLLLWNPDRNHLPSKPKKKKSIKDENMPESPDDTVSVDNEDMMTKEESSALPAPQVMIGPDGNIVLNTESLLISAPEKDEKQPKIIVEEDDDDRYLNTNSYRKCQKRKFWSEEETDNFFLGLSMCGTDFSLLTKLLTNRSRRELKNKFRREEKYNRPRVDKSLANMRRYDPAIFAEKTQPLLPPPAPKPKIKKQSKEKAVKETEPVAVKTKKEKPAKRAAKKRKQSQSSEEEEDDWGSDYDRISDEDEIPVAKVPNTKKPGQKTGAVSGKWKKEEIVENENKSTSSQSVTRDSPLPEVNITTAAASTANTARQGMPTIPGTTQVQIEVAGVQAPVQGMLIPSHMVPSFAPQLGLGQGALSARTQILLVHEEAIDGSLVHVYIIPEDGSPAVRTGERNQSTCQQSQQHQATGHTSAVSGKQIINRSMPYQDKSSTSSVSSGVVSNQAQLSSPAPFSPRAITTYPPTKSSFPPTSGKTQSQANFPPVPGSSPSFISPGTSSRSPVQFPTMTNSTRGASPMQQASPTVRSPFPPQPSVSSRKYSSFPPTPSPTNQNPGTSQVHKSPVQSSYPMSPPPLQGTRPLARIPQPLPQRPPVKNIYPQCAPNQLNQEILQKSSQNPFQLLNQTIPSQAEVMLNSRTNISPNLSGVQPVLTSSSQNMSNSINSEYANNDQTRLISANLHLNECTNLEVEREQIAGKNIRADEGTQESTSESSSVNTEMINTSLAVTISEAQKTLLVSQQDVDCDFAIIGKVEIKSPSKPSDVS